MKNMYRRHYAHFKNQPEIRPQMQLSKRKCDGVKKVTSMTCTMVADERFGEYHVASPDAPMQGHSYHVHFSHLKQVENLLLGLDSHVFP